MKSIYTFVFTVCLMFPFGPSFAQTSEKELLNQVLHLDSLFWTAYNQCNVEAMEKFFTTDVEFYHDKGGLTQSSEKLFEQVRQGLCGKEDWRLRREAVTGSVHVFPMNNYGAIISGEHYFYINEKGKPEYLDGHARFTHVWRFQYNEWKMHRILSYDHKPAPAEAKAKFLAAQKKHR